MKRKVRKREKIWRKYKEEHQWSALKIAQKEYQSALRRSRISKISEMVNACKGNIKKLCSLVHNITGNVKGNPLPDSISYEDLADRFGDFFMEKIRKIHDELDKILTYKPTRPAGQKSFSRFSAMTEDEVEKL